MSIKLYKFYIITTVLIISSCGEVKNTISNIPGEINEFYEFNLGFTEDTDNSDTITLTWTENTDITVFNIKMDGEIDIGLDGSQYTFPLLPGSFKDVIIMADDILSDTIKVFSSPMAPSTWVPDIYGIIKVSNSETEDGFKNQFEWNASIETDISNIELYKSSQSATEIIANNVNINLTIWSKIASFDINSVSPFSEDGLSQGEDYCYIIKSIDGKGHSRFSQIICNAPSLSLSDHIVDIFSTSNNLKNKIHIEWDSYNEPDFYQYSLYRSENIDIDNDSRILLANIIDVNQTKFEDRNNIGKGKTWFYQLEVHNQYGRISKSNITSGKSKP